jgi:hypothetical protein
MRARLFRVNACTAPGLPAIRYERYESIFGIEAAHLYRS